LRSCWPFRSRTAGNVDGTEKAAFFVSFLATTASSALLIAPSAFHRIQWREKDKEHLLAISNRLAIAPWTKEWNVVHFNNVASYCGPSAIREPGRVERDHCPPDRAASPCSRGAARPPRLDPLAPGSSRRSGSSALSSLYGGTATRFLDGDGAGYHASVEIAERPTETFLTLTPFAAAKVKELVAEEPDAESLVLRVAIQGGGCSGFQYGLGFDTGTADGDHEFEFEGVRVVVDPSSAPYLKGATIDFLTGLQESGFKIDNPNAVSSCGCGHSFQVDEGAEDDAAVGGCGSGCSQ
jgi:iron-sulfur cluster assembly protein